MKYLIIISLAAFVACQTVDRRKLVWSDEFNTPGKPDQTKWSYDVGNSENGWGNNELEYYTDDPKNVRVEDGNLVIEAIKESKEGLNYTSTRILSKNKGDWTYGRIEIRAKLPKGRGTWPAIWMLPTEWKYGGWPESGEIDIMEHVGFDPGVVHANLHSGKYNHIKKTNIDGKITVADAMDNFHVYAIDWTKDQIDFYVDDKMYHSLRHQPGDDFMGWPFDQKFHLIMNIAVGGGWGGQQGVDESVWPQKMLIDYVRVYQ
jgi:beta-glucanase (GH16 family)